MRNKPIKNATCMVLSINEYDYWFEVCYKGKHFCVSMIIL